MYTYQSSQIQVAVGTPLVRNQGVGWRTRAIAAYQPNQPDAAELCHMLTSALQALIGHSVAAEAIVVDLPGRTAFVRLDGVLFRLADGQLFVIRPCAHCGLGAFTSPPVTSTGRLGFAISDWQPLHADCQPFEADTID